MIEDILKNELKLLREREYNFNLTSRKGKYVLKGEIANIPIEFVLPEDFPESPPVIKIPFKLPYKILSRKIPGKLETIQKWKPTFNLYMVANEIKNNMAKLDEKTLKNVIRKIKTEKRKKKEIIRPSIETLKPKPPPLTPPISSEKIQISSGYERIGEYIKVGIKIKNNSKTTISDVLVHIIVPDGLQFIDPRSRTINIKTIKKGESQSAIFRLKPVRCIDGLIQGSVEYVDAYGNQRWLKINPLRITNICPMLTGENVSVDEILGLLKTSALKCNHKICTFEADPKIVFKMAVKRASGLILLDKCEEELDDSYLAYACYIGKTKYKNFKFAVEINVSAKNGRGVLSIITYSDEEAILTGFFTEIMEDLKEHIKVVEETEQVITDGCPNCGRPIIPTKKYIINAEKGIIRCKACNSLIKIPKWKIKYIAKN